MLTCHPQPQRRRTTCLSTFTQTSSTMKDPPTSCWWIASRDGPSYRRQAAEPQPHTHHRWRTRIHRPWNKRSADQLGGPPPDFLSIPPSREQPHRNRGQNSQEAHRREHRPRGYPEASVFQGTPDLQELPLPRHTDVTGHVSLWPTNQRSATYPPNMTSTANPGRYDPAHEADSTKEAPIPGQEMLDRAHQGALPPQTQRQWCKTRQATTQPNGTAQAWWSRSCSTISIRSGWTATAD